MKRILGAAAAAAVLPMGASAGARPILYDAVALNIGVNCQWQQRCMGQQRRALKDAQKFIANSRPCDTIACWFTTLFLRRLSCP